MIHHNNNLNGSVDRRSFLLASLASAPVALAAKHAIAGDNSRPSNIGDAAVQKVRDRMKGPMASITMPYNKDYSIDHGALRGWVDYMCEKKIPILFLTHGDSEIYNLKEQEIEAVTRTVAEQARGRSLVLGGTPHGWTGQLVDLINRMEDFGVDAVNVHLYTTNEEEIHRALSQVSEKTRLPLLAAESRWSTKLVKRIAQIPRFVGMKCHSELYGYYNHIRSTQELGFGVLSAGQMKHFLFGYLIGSPAYLCPLAPFAPEISLRFYHLLTKGDVEAARQVIFDYEEPLIKITGLLGYPNSYKSALYLTGHFKNTLMRPPKHTNKIEELEPLRKFFKQKGILG